MFACVALLLLASAQRGPLQARPDIVVFVIDDLADSDVDDISSRGWLPNLDQMALDGMRYRRAYAHAKCHPTRDSAMYSKWLGLDRGDACGPPVGATHPTADYSLAEMLDGAGYNTVHIGKWHTGAGPFGPFELAAQLVGFDSTRALLPIGESCGELAPGSDQYLISDGVGAVFSGENTIALRDAFLKWWAATPAPRYASVNFIAAHEPFIYPDASLLPPSYPPCGLANCTNRRRYQAEVVGVDTAIGQMRAAIGSNAYVIFTGDNGTPGIVPGRNPADTVATRTDQDPSRVKLTCYEDGVRVPLIVTGPLVVHGESQALVHLVDLMPTLSRIAGIKPDPDSMIHGRQFAGTLLGGIGSRSYVFCWNPPPRLDRALIETRWKLLTREDGIEEMYDLQNDPHELAPLPAVGPDAERMRSLRDSILAGSP